MTTASEDMTIGCYECAWGKVAGCWRCGSRASEDIALILSDPHVSAESKVALTVPAVFTRVVGRQRTQAEVLFDADTRHVERRQYEAEAVRHSAFSSLEVA